MKREYMKPTMNVVELQHQHQLLAGSITDVAPETSAPQFTPPATAPETSAEQKIHRLAGGSTPSPATTKKI